MALLSGNILYTVDELASKLGLSQRSIYRYLDTFKEAGFSVEKVRDYVYRLTTLNSAIADLSNIVYFSEEEAYIMNRLIDGLDQSNTLKAGLKQKLASIYDHTSIAEFVDRRSNAKLIETLSEAIREKKVVLLEGYTSSYSGKTKDYRLEPFKFTDNYSGVWAYDLDALKNKRFKILRMGDVIKCNDPWTMEHAHHATPMDPFGIHGEEEYHVVLRMNNVAKNLMVEEFPLTEDLVHPEEEESEEGTMTLSQLILPLHSMDSEEEQYWIYDGMVRGIDGIGRFVLGLQRNIEVVEGDLLKEFLVDNAMDILEQYEER